MGAGVATSRPAPLRPVGLYWGKQSKRTCFPGRERRLRVSRGNKQNFTLFAPVIKAAAHLSSG